MDHGWGIWTAVDTDDANSLADRVYPRLQDHAAELANYGKLQAFVVIGAQGLRAGFWGPDVAAFHPHAERILEEVLTSEVKKESP